MLNILKNLTAKLPELESDLRHRASLSQHARNLPGIDSKGHSILSALKHEGVYITSLSDLGLASSPQLLYAADHQLATMGNPLNSNLEKKLPQIYTVTDLSGFSAWGREKKLLGIIENYIGLPVAFHGVHLRKDFPSENQFGTLLWHKDSEDRRMIKIIVYLSDVEKKHGPFEYVPLHLTSARSLAFYRVYHELWKSGYLGINDDQLQEVIPRSAWKSCPGPAGTVILVDTKNVLHHGTLRTEERAALFFTYTADPPERPELCTQYWDDTFARPDRKVQTT
jgi:hypothetical protein